MRLDPPARYRYRVANLKIPKPGDQKQENAHDPVLKKRSFHSRIWDRPENRLIWNALRLIGLDGYKTHN